MGDINLYHGDSSEILPTLEDKSVDLILTDPLYDLTQEVKGWYHNQFLRLSRGGIIVFSPPENPWILPAKQYLFWVKPLSTKNTSKSYSRFVEQIFIYENGTWNHDRHWSQYTNVFTDIVDSAKLHPFRKPLSMLERLILNHSNISDIVLDPFCGIGSVGEVCKRLDRNYIGIEKEESYYKIGLKNLGIE